VILYNTNHLRFFANLSLPVLSLRSAHAAWASITELGEIIIPKSHGRSEFLDECKSGAFDGVTVAFRTFESFGTTGLIDEEIVSVLPKSLKYICHNGASRLISHVAYKVVKNKK
jgi:hypothetical protein